MIRTCVATLALLLAPVASATASDPAPAPPPTLSEVLASSAPSDWRPLDPANTLYMELDGGDRVVIALAPAFAPRHIENIRVLVAGRFYDGVAVTRSQENYVVQWGDPAQEGEPRRGFGKAKASLEPELARPLEGLSVTLLEDADPYAAAVGFADGLPIGVDPAAKEAWLAHCHGMVGVGRDVAASSGNGAELYVVIGHAPRHLDLNVTLVGRVVAGIEHLSTLPRGTAALGFYEDPADYVAVRSIPDRRRAASRRARRARDPAHRHRHLPPGDRRAPHAHRELVPDPDRPGRALQRAAARSAYGERTLSRSVECDPAIWCVAFRTARLIGIAGTLALAIGASTLAASQSPTGFELTDLPIAVEGDLGAFRLAIETAQIEDGVEIATLRLTAESPTPPPVLDLTWSLPAVDIYGQWTTAARFRKTLRPSWAPTSHRSALARGAPVLALFGSDDGNRLTWAVSDARETVTLEAGLREEDARVYGRVELFGGARPAVREVEVELRFDRRPVPFHQALGEVAAWWASRPGMRPAPVPELARRPMYSTWYAYHQSVSSAALLGEARSAVELGYEAMIVDDGWQTLDDQRGYAYTGDWRPERMPEMRAFVDGMHEIGMDVLLWYSLPLVGERSAIFERFEGRYLRYWEGQGAWVLDPRYPEVRQHLVETCLRAVDEWGVDGFKLDFLGFFVADAETELTAEDGRDHASVNAATDRLMTDLLTALRDRLPDALVEFRQPYIGPLMRTYGNMFRAGDAPDMAVDNRVRTIDLRLLSGDTAVHSDMLMWHYDEPVETAALQLLNALFSVPQLSVRLAEIPPTHREMVTFWTSYWTRRRDVLLDGTLEPEDPLANYPRVAAHTDDARVVALYSAGVVPLAEPVDQIDVVNARSDDSVVIDSSADLGAYRYRAYDCRGRVTASGQLELDDGVHRISVPAAGLLSLERP